MQRGNPSIDRQQPGYRDQCNDFDGNRHWTGNPRLQVEANAKAGDKDQAQTP